MSQFDPYCNWLGIPPHEQPPTHYRLLGIPLFEANPETIAQAAQRQAVHIQAFLAGPQAEACQFVLNHLALAQQCLLDPQQKALYDQQLGETLGARTERTVSAPPPLPGMPPVGGFFAGAMPVAVGPTAEGGAFGPVAPPFAPMPAYPAAPQAAPFAPAAMPMGGPMPGMPAGFPPPGFPPGFPPPGPAPMPQAMPAAMGVRAPVAAAAAPVAMQMAAPMPAPVAVPMPATRPAPMPVARPAPTARAMPMQAAAASPPSPAPPVAPPVQGTNGSSPLDALAGSEERPARLSRRKLSHKAKPVSKEVITLCVVGAVAALIGLVFLVVDFGEPHKRGLERVKPEGKPAAKPAKHSAHEPAKFPKASSDSSDQWETARPVRPRPPHLAPETAVPPRAARPDARPDAIDEGAAIAAPVFDRPPPATRMPEFMTGGTPAKPKHPKESKDEAPDLGEQP